MPIPTELLATITGRLIPADGPATAAHALRVWTILFDKFAPLLGPLGAQLIFSRSLRLASEVFPWLPQPAADAQHDAFTQFEACLDGLTTEELLAVNRTLLEHHTAMLENLIGEGLATRLLRSAFPEDDPDKKSLEKTV